MSKQSNKTRQTILEKISEAAPHKTKEEILREFAKASLKASI